MTPDFVENQTYEKLLLKYIDIVSPEYVLEWGPGYSSKLILDNSHNLKKLYSIEHCKKYYEPLKEYFLDEKRFDLHYVPFYEDYINYYKNFTTKKFDLIFVDGVARIDCLRKAKNILNKNGVIILHDAQREEYNPGINLFNFMDWDEPDNREFTVALR